jgi:hypothetical protein
MCAQEDQEASSAPGQVSLNSNSEQQGGQQNEEKTILGSNAHDS